MEAKMDRVEEKAELVAVVEIGILGVVHEAALVVVEAEAKVKVGEERGNYELARNGSGCCNSGAGFLFILCNFP